MIWNWKRHALPLLALLPLTACGRHPLTVQAAQPLPAPRQACSEVTAYALSLRDWALDISAPALAVPAGAP